MENKLEELSPVQILALSKVLNKAELSSARAEIPPGEYDVPRFLVGVTGSLVVSEDESYTPTTSVSLIGATCLAIRRMGIQREAFLKCLKEVCQEALSHDEGTRSALMAEANVKEFEIAFKEQFTSQLPKRDRKGKVKADVGALTLEAIDREQTEHEAAIVAGIREECQGSLVDATTEEPPLPIGEDYPETIPGDSPF